MHWGIRIVINNGAAKKLTQGGKYCQNIRFYHCLKKVKNHLVQFWSYNVQVEIKVVRNVILNNFDLSVRFDREHRFPSRSIQSWHVLQNFCNLAEILQLCRLLDGKRCTLANLSLMPKLFKITFLTTFISTSTLYNQN